MYHLAYNLEHRYAGIEKQRMMLATSATLFMVIIM